MLKLKSVDFALVDEDGTSLVSSTLDGLQAGLVYRPGGWRLDTVASSLVVNQGIAGCTRGMQLARSSPHSMRFREMQSKCFAAVERCLPESLRGMYSELRLGEGFVMLQLETSSDLETGGTATQFAARISTLQVFYARCVVEATIEFFQRGVDPSEYQYLERLAAQGMAKMASDIDLMEAARELHSNQVVLDIEVHAPVLLLPEDASCSAGSPVLSISLGNFSCDTATVAERAKLHDADGAEDVAGKVKEAEVYDAYTLELVQTSVVLIPDAAEWLSRWFDASGDPGPSAVELLAPSKATKIELGLRKCVVDNSETFPALCLDMLVHPIEVQLLPAHIEAVASVALQIQPRIPDRSLGPAHDEPEAPRHSQMGRAKVPRRVPQPSMGNIRHLSLKVILERVCVQVATADAALVRLDLAQLVVDVLQNEHDSTVHFSLGSLAMKDLYTDSQDPMFQQLASGGCLDSAGAAGESDELTIEAPSSLLELKLEAAAPKSEKELRAQVCIDLKVGKLTLGLNHLTAAALLERFVLPLLPLLPKLKAGLQPKDVSSAASPPSSPKDPSRSLTRAPATPASLSRSASVLNSSLFRVQSAPGGSSITPAASGRDLTGLTMIPTTKRFAKKWRKSSNILPILSFEANLDGASQSIRCEEIEHVVASAEVSQVSLKFELHPDDSVQLAIIVGSLQVDSSLPSSRPFRTILKSKVHTVTQSAVNFKFSTPPLEAQSEQRFPAAELCVGSLELVLLNTVAEEVIGYAQNSPLTKQLLDVCQRVPQLLAQDDLILEPADLIIEPEENQDDPGGGAFCNLVLSLESPILIVPRLSESTEHMCLRFDTLSVTNQLDLSAAEGICMDVITLKVVAASAATTNAAAGPPTEDGLYTKLLDDTTLELVLRRSIDFGMLRAKVEVPKISVHASQQQLEVVMAILFENLAEQSEYTLPVVSQPDLVRSSPTSQSGSEAPALSSRLDIGIDVSLQQMFMEVLDSADPSQVASIATLDLGKATATFTQNSSGAMRAQITMHSLSLMDSRSDRKAVINEPIICTEQDAENGALSVKVEQGNSDEVMLAQVKSGALKVCVSPDTVHAWFDFAMRVAQNITVMPVKFIPQAVASNQADAAIGDEPENAEDERSPSSPSSTGMIQMHLDLNAGKVTVKVPANESSVLMLQMEQCAANIDIEDDVQTIDAQIVLSAYRAPADDDEVHTFDMLKPYELSIHGKKMPLSQTGWLQLMAMQLFISHHELKMLMQLQQEYEPVVARLHAFKRQRSGQLHRGNSNGSTPTSPKMSRADLSRVDSLNSTDSTLKPQTMFEIAAEMLLVTLMDRSLDPVIDVQARDVRAMFQSGGTSRSNEATVQFVLDSCRRSITASAWEPVLEPARCTIALESRTAILGSSTTSIDIRVPDALNLVLCADLIQCLGNAIAATDLASESDQSIKAAGCKLRIMNNTCSGLVVTATAESLSTQTVEVPPLKSGELPLQSAVLSRHSEEDSRKTSTIDITLGDGWGELTEFDTSLLGQRVYKIANAATGTQARVVLCVYLEARTRLLTVASEVLVQNKCSLPVKALIESAEDGAKVELGVVQPGRYVPVPFGVISGVLQLQPQKCTHWKPVLDLTATSLAARDQDVNRAAAELVENFGDAVDEELILCTPPCEAQIGEKSKPVRLRLFFTKSKLFLYGNVFGCITKHTANFSEVKQLHGDRKQAKLEFSQDSGAPTLTFSGFANPKRTFQLLESSVRENTQQHIDQAWLAEKYLEEFGLSNEEYVDKFATASGDLVLSIGHVCHRESSLFGDTVRVVIPVSSITNVEMTKKNWVVPCIQITATDFEPLEVVGLLNQEAAFNAIEKLRASLAENTSGEAKEAAHSELENALFHAASSVVWPAGPIAGQDGVCVMITSEDQRLQKRGFKTKLAPYEITIHTPVTIRNLLHTNIRFELFENGSDAPAYYSDVCTAERLCIAKAADPAHPMWMSIALGDNEAMSPRFEIDRSSIPGKPRGNLSFLTIDDAYTTMEGSQRLHLSVEVLVQPLGAGLEVVLFVPFLVKNSTPMSLALDAKSRGCQTTVPPGESIMFDFIPGSEEQDLVVTNELQPPGESGNASFSEPFSVNSLSSGCIKIPGDPEVHVAVSIAAAPGNTEAWRMKCIEFRPRFKIFNETSMHVAYCAGDKDGVQGSIPPADSIALMGVSFESQLLMKLRFQPAAESEDSQWSTPFAIQDPIKTVLQAPTQDGSATLVEVVAMLLGSTMAVHLKTTDVKALYMVRNATPLAVSVSQDDGANWEPVDATAERPVIWQDQLASHQVKVKVGESWCKTIHMDVVEEHQEADFRYQVQVSQDGTHVMLIEPCVDPDDTLNLGLAADSSWQITSDTQGKSPARPLQYDAGQDCTSDLGSGAGSGSGDVAANATGDGADWLSGGLDAEPDDDVQQYSVFTIALQVEALGVSLIDSIPAEVFYLYLTSISTELSTTEAFDGTGELGLELKIHAIQIDNLLHGAPFSLLFSAGQMSDPAARPAVHLSVAKQQTTNSVLKFRYFSLLLQPMFVSVDEASLSHLYRLGMEFGSAVPASTGRSSPEAKPLLVYFAVFELHPISLSISTDQSGEVEVDPGLSKYRIGKKVAHALGSKTKSSTDLPEIDLACLRLNALKLQSLACNEHEFGQRLADHFSQQFLRQLLVLVGSSSVLGNPAGLFNSVSTGVVDFFYEPAQGMIQSPSSFARGLAKGSSSLVSNTTSGLFDTTSKLTGSIGAGFAFASGDDSYMLELQQRERRARMGGASSGVQEAASALGSGFVDGVTGVVTAPVDGASSDGVGGFLKGLGKGVAGAVVKPVSGIFQAAGLASGAVKSGLAGGHPGNQLHIRLRRALAPNGVIRGYDSAAAACQQALRSGLGAVSEYYVAHAEVTDGRFVLSDGHLVLLQAAPESEHAQWAVGWMVAATNVARVVLYGEGQIADIELDGDESSRCRLEAPATSSGAAELAEICNIMVTRFPHIVLTPATSDSK